MSNLGKISAKKSGTNLNLVAMLALWLPVLSSIDFYGFSDLGLGEEVFSSLEWSWFKWALR